jgi:hypothetical protein
MTEETSKQKVSTTEGAMKTKATRVSDAEILAVSRHQKINLIWEYTQAYMAIIVITTVLGSSTYIAISTQEDSKRNVALAFMIGLANLVAGFYFGRTNHTRPTGEDKS